MNEEDLKTIWKKDEPFPLETFDFERIKTAALDSQKKLQRKIRWDISVNVLLYVLISPVFYYFPRIVVVLPFMLAVWIWYFREIFKIYRYDNDFRKQANIKKFLAGKEKLLTNYITQTRYIGYFGMPFVLLICYAGMTSFTYLKQNPVNFLLSLVSSEILIFVIFELYIKKIYAPVIDELKDLLQQLSD